MESWSDHGISLTTNRRGETDELCPKCSHTRKHEHRRHKCLSVNTDEGTWFCHNCGWAGALRRTDRDPARRAPKVHVRPRVDANALSPASLQWFDERGISREVLARNKIAERDGAILFPYYRDGELVNVKYRKLPKQFRMEKDAELCLYGLDDCRDAEEVVFVEGEMDKIACETATGRLAVVSVPNGAKTRLDTVLGSASEILAGSRRFLIGGDNDVPGRELAEDLARRLGYERCWRVDWPAGCKDANDTLVECGRETVVACLADATPYPIAGIITVGDVNDEIDDLYERGMPPGLSTGWPSLDRFYTVREGQLTVVTGIPSSGKSVWLDALLVNLARLHGIRLGLCSPEQQPTQRHFAKLIAKYVGLPFGAGPTPRMTREEMDDGKKWVADHFALVLPDENTVDAIIERGRMLVVRHGIRGFVVDPWTEVDHTRPSGMNETEFIHRSLAKLRAFGRNHGVHVWVVAHPRMLYRDKTTGLRPTPTPYDISGSAAWYNKADNCLTVERDKENPANPVSLHIQKVRFHEIGGLGRVEFAYDVATERYSEWRG